MGSGRTPTGSTSANGTTANARTAQLRWQAIGFAALNTSAPRISSLAHEAKRFYIPKRMAGQRLTTPWRRLGWPVAAGLLIMVAHLPSFMHRLLDGDEAIYGSIAALVNVGGGLYGAGGIDNKPPGVFWIYALLFRVFGEYQMTAVHVAGFTALASTCAVLFLIARGLAGSRAGLISALLYRVLTAAGNPRLLASNPEVFMRGPLSASVLLTLRRRWFWTGC